MAIARERLGLYFRGAIGIGLAIVAVALLAYGIRTLNLARWGGTATTLVFVGGGAIICGIVAGIGSMVLLNRVRSGATEETDSL